MVSQITLSEEVLTAELLGHSALAITFTKKKKKKILVVQLPEGYTYAM
jgi:hypothetical protein